MKDFFELFEDVEAQEVKFQPIPTTEDFGYINYEYQSLIECSEEDFNQEKLNSIDILNFKIGAPVDFPNLKPPVSNLLKTLLIYLTLSKQNDLKKFIVQVEENRVFEILKIITYKLLLNASNLHEASSILLKLANYLYINSPSSTPIRKYSEYIYKIATNQL